MNKNSNDINFNDFLDNDITFNKWKELFDYYASLNENNNQKTKLDCLIIQFQIFYLLSSASVILENKEETKEYGLNLLKLFSYLDVNKLFNTID